MRYCTLKGTARREPSNAALAALPAPELRADTASGIFMRERPSTLPRTTSTAACRLCGGKYAPEIRRPAAAAVSAAVAATGGRQLSTEFQRGRPAARRCLSRALGGGCSDQSSFSSAGRPDVSVGRDVAPDEPWRTGGPVSWETHRQTWRELFRSDQIQVAWLLQTGSGCEKWLETRSGCEKWLETGAWLVGGARSDKCVVTGPGLSTQMVRGTQSYILRNVWKYVIRAGLRAPFDQPCILS